MACGGQHKGWDWYRGKKNQPCASVVLSQQTSLLSGSLTGVFSKVLASGQGLEQGKALGCRRAGESSCRGMMGTSPERPWGASLGGGEQCESPVWCWGRGEQSYKGGWRALTLNLPVPLVSSAPPPRLDVICGCSLHLPVKQHQQHLGCPEGGLQLAVEMLQQC